MSFTKRNRQRIRKYFFKIKKFNFNLNFSFKEHFFNPKSHRGHLGWWIRRYRSKNPVIQTRPYKRSINLVDNEPETNIMTDLENYIIFMKNKFICTDQDKRDVEDAMEKTKKYRLEWIKTKAPSITEIIEKYPKYLQIFHLVVFYYFFTFYQKITNLIVL